MIRAGLIGWIIAFAAGASAQVYVIDPGHGGTAPGASGCGLVEEAVALDVGRRLQVLLTADGLRTLLTREADVSVGINARARFANSNGARRFMSIHLNSATRVASGTETFVRLGASSATFAFARVEQQEMLSEWNLPNRGVKTDDKSAEGSLGVLRGSRMPATLAEIGFINHCSRDAVILSNDTELQNIAGALRRAVLRDLGRNVTDPVVPGTPPPTETTGKLHGVLFEDTGTGAMDTTRRIAIGSIHIVEVGTTIFSDNEGIFVWDLRPGTYTIEASKTGFQTLSRRCVVTLGEDTWCSIGLRSGAQTGVARGVIFEERGSGLADTAVRIENALVRVVETGEELPTDVAGAFRFSLAPGSYTLVAEHDGHVTGTRSCEVTADSETWCSFGMTAVGNTGALQGFVYVGTVDSRLPGVEVVLETSDQRVFSSAGEAYFRFETVPGTHRIRVEGEGIVTTTRTCTVENGQEVWCSIPVELTGEGGLMPVAVADSGPEIEVNPDAGEEEELDGGVIDEAGMSDRDGIHSGCESGCSSQTGGGGFVSLLFLLAALRKRSGRKSQRRFLGILLLTMIGCSTEPREGVSELRSRLEGAPQLEVHAVPVSSPTEMVDEIEPVARTASSESTLGDLWLSPNGRYIALAAEAYESLSIFNIERGVEVRLPTEHSAFEPEWHADGRRLAVRVDGQSIHDAPLLAFDVLGHPVAPFDNVSIARVFVQNDQIVIRGDGGEVTIAPPGDRYFAPVLSPDGRFVAFEGLSTGLYLWDRRLRRLHGVGAGTRPRFYGNHVYYDRVTEVGHAIIDVDVWQIHLADVLTTSSVLAEQTSDSSVARSGDRVFFLRDGRLMNGVIHRPRSTPL